MKKIKQDTPRVKVSIAAIDDANDQYNTVLRAARGFAHRADAAIAERDKAKRNLFIVSIALVVVSLVLAIVGVGMVLS